MKKLFTLIIALCSTTLIAQNTYEYRISIDGMYETYDEGEDIVNHTENDDGEFLSVHQYFIDSETQEVSLIKHAADGEVMWRRTLNADPDMIFTFIDPPEICSFADRYAMIQNQVVTAPVIETHHSLTLLDEDGEVLQEHSLAIADQQQFADVIPYDGGFAVASSNVQYPDPPPFGNTPFINRIFAYTTDIDGNRLWEKQILFEDDTWGERLILYEILSDTDDNLYIFCSYEFAHDGLIIVKLDPDGEVVFINKYQDPALETWGYDPQCRAAINTQGDLFCYLSWQNNPGVAQYTNLYKFDTDGELQFSKRIEELVFVSSLSNTGEDGFAILFPNLNNQFGIGYGDSKDPALATFDKNGNFDWGYIYGEEGDNFSDRHIVCDDRGYMIWSHTESDFYMIKTDIEGNSGCDKTPMTINTVDFDVETTIPDWSEIDFPETVEVSYDYTEQEAPQLEDKCCLMNLAIPEFEYSFTENEFEIAFTNSSTNADSYAWNFGDNTNSGYENPVHTFPGVGEYNVCLTVYNECMDDDYCINIVIENEPPIGIDEIISFSNIYPNPSNGSIEIESKKPLNKISFYNQQGQVLHTRILSGYHQKLSTETLPKGLYFIKISYEGDLESHHKIMVN